MKRIFILAFLLLFTVNCWADKTIDQYDALTTPSDDDLLLVEDSVILTINKGIRHETSGHGVYYGAKHVHKLG